MIRISPQQFQELTEFIRSYSGILLDRIQPKGLPDKVAGEIKRLGLQSFDDYLFLLKSASGNLARDYLMSMVAVTESFFFRNPSQFRYLARELFPALYKSKRATGLDRITIWSAGCATGEEAYSIAYIANWFLRTHADISFSIAGTDLNFQSIDKARVGLYRTRSFRAQSQEIKREFILPVSHEEGDGQQVEEGLRRMVEFKTVNLRDLPGLKSRQGTDIIFCRNVMIYFEERFRDELLATFHSLLPPGGMLFLGETESLPQKCRLFELIPCHGAYGYRKPLSVRPETGPKPTVEAKP